jgi:hypothetical protein
MLFLNLKLAKGRKRKYTSYGLLHSEDPLCPIARNAEMSFLKERNFVLFAELL